MDHLTNNRFPTAKRREILWRKHRVDKKTIRCGKSGPQAPRKLAGEERDGYSAEDLVRLETEGETDTETEGTSVGSGSRDVEGAEAKPMRRSLQLPLELPRRDIDKRERKTVENGRGSRVEAWMRSYSRTNMSDIMVAFLSLATFRDQNGPHQRRRDLMTTGDNDAKNIRDDVMQSFDNADGCRTFNHDKDDLTRRRDNLEDWTRASLDARDPVELYNTLHVNFPLDSPVDKSEVSKDNADDDFDVNF
ncbi:MAG: hypothetical protein Q9175_000268 [Cornicularia normoerica]